MSQLQQELVSLEVKKAELASKSKAAQRLIGEHAAAIEAMKKSRDEKLERIDKLQVGVARG